MVVISVNTGSTSVRLAVHERWDATSPATSSTSAPVDGDPRAALGELLAPHDDVTAVVHRVVDGGGRDEPCVVDDDVEAEIEASTERSPLHAPRALRWIRAARAASGPDVPQLAVFDTAFTAGLSDVAATYALPHELCARHGLRRRGFHGIAHAAQWRRFARDRDGRGRLVSVHLGGGCSITSVADGRAVDTTMGFTPLEGLVMATRSGDVDPGLLVYLQRHADLDVDALDDLLNRRSGLLGLSGLSGRMDELLASDEPRARLAVDVFCWHARKAIGAALATLGGADAIVFGGGVGENAPAVRAKALDGMAWCGIRLDEAVNADTAGVDARISTDDAAIDVHVRGVDEAVEMVAQASHLWEGSR